MTLMDIFRTCITFFKGQILQEIRKNYKEVRPTNDVIQDIQFILTIPAKWNDEARTMLKDAAIKVKKKANKYAAI